MDHLDMGGKLFSLFKKYRYVLLILLVGLLLMLLPTGGQERSEPQPDISTEKSVDISEQLREILSCIDGAGKVEVMVSIAQGEKTQFQTDLDISGSENGSTRQDTVIITDANRQENGLISQINPPVYRGAVVICQGADRASVRLAIEEAVSSITGLGTDRIVVLKMK